MFIAIIDDGVFAKAIKCKLLSFQVSHGHISNICTNENPVSVLSHGTLCAKIIEKHVRDLTIISIRIFEEGKGGDPDDLYQALKWCVGKKIDFINISNGYTGFCDTQNISRVCYDLWINNTVIFAAMSNWWDYTVPANLPYVYGVGRKILFAKNKLVFKPDIYMSGAVVRFGRRKVVGSYNSVACARACNKYAREKQKYERFHLKWDKQIVDRAEIFLQIYNFSEMGNLIWMDSDKARGYLDNSIILPKSITFNTSHDFTAIIFDDWEIDDLINRLDEFKNSLYCIVYLSDAIPPELKKWCIRNKIRYWYEKNDHLKIDSNYSISVPAIGIYGKDENYEYVKRIESFFESREYTVLLIFLKKYGYLNLGIKASNYNELVEKVVCYRTDLILLYSLEDKTHTNYNDIKCTTDIDIQLDDQFIKIVWEEGKKFFLRDEVEESLDFLYDLLT